MSKAANFLGGFGLAIAKGKMMKPKKSEPATQPVADVTPPAAVSEAGPWDETSAKMETPANVSSQTPEFHLLDLPDFDFPAQA